MRPRSLLFRQLFEHVSSTYTYIVGCPATKQAVIIDPVIEMAERDAQMLHQLGVEPVYGMNTHVHADHVTATGELRKQHFPSMRTVISKRSHARADRIVDHGDLLHVGGKTFEVRATPGHTNGCVTYVLHDDRMAFTGDTLLIRGCGRTDFQEGNARTLYRSVQEQIFSLPDDYLLFPAHDYNGVMSSSVGEEKRFNPRLTKSEDEFVEIMHNLHLNYPEQIDKAVPANMVCGVFDEMDEKTLKAVKASRKN